MSKDEIAILEKTVIKLLMKNTELEKQVIDHKDSINMWYNKSQNQSITIDKLKEELEKIKETSLKQ